MVNPCDMPCPKCGAADIYRRFHAKNTSIDNSKYNVAEHPGFTSRGCTSYARKNIVVHHCRCCQYEWATAPLLKQR